MRTRRRNMFYNTSACADHSSELQGDRASKRRQECEYITGRATWSIVCGRVRKRQRSRLAEVLQRRRSDVRPSTALERCSQGYGVGQETSEALIGHKGRRTRGGPSPSPRARVIAVSVQVDRPQLSQHALSLVVHERAAWRTGGRQRGTLRSVASF